MTQSTQAALADIAEVSQLKAQRASVKGSISRIKNQFENVTHYDNAIELECRLDIVNSYIKTLMAYQSAIEKIEPDDVKRPELEELCIATKSKLLSLLGSRRRQSTAEYTMSVAPTQTKRLPNLKLPSFNGKLSEYKEFISLFTDLVHEEHSLSNIEKFNHLLTCLSGEALRTVQSLHVTGDNYQKAIDLLQERYDNKTLIFFDTVEQMFNVPPLHKQDACTLRQAVDTISNKHQSLLSLGSDKEIIDAMLIHLIVSKIDTATKAKWYDQLNYSQMPTWKACTQFLIRQCQSWHSTYALKNSDNGTYQNIPKANKQNLHTKFALPCAQQGDNKCICCHNALHALYQCDMFLAMSIQKRFELVKRNGFCTNCLRKGHNVVSCKASRCRVCKKTHHTLLHRYEIPSVNSHAAIELERHHINESSIANNHANITSLPTMNSAQCTANSEVVEEVVLLATAIVKIQDAFGNWHHARALLDSGSQISCITHSLANLLKIEKSVCNLNVFGIGNSRTNVKHKIHTIVQSNTSDYSFNADFWLLTSIAGNVPNYDLPTDTVNIPAGTKLADDTFHKKQRLDMLLGADVFFDLLCGGKQMLKGQSSYMLETHLGWIVAGRHKPSKEVNVANVLTTTNVDEHLNTLDTQLVKFWELEEVKIEKINMSPEHTECERHFIENFIRLSNGQCQVRLPFKQNPSALGFSYNTAKRRFLSLERRLNKSPSVKKMYVEFMKEYLQLNHMQIYNKQLPKICYFIPHQVVLKLQSETTKLRVVFDASCKTSTNISLNDTLMVGPTIQNDLYTLLLKFRSYKYVLTADITKMYRQIVVDERDRQFQLIMWRECENHHIQIYQLNTVTYGTAPAPFLAIRCLVELGNIYCEKYPIGAEVLRNDFYVDDLLTGAHELYILKQKRDEITHILNSAGLHLAKWKSNVLEPDNVQPLEIQYEEYTKALGIMWHPKSDTWTYHINLEDADVCTKRNILSISSRLFDPLGLVCPIVTAAKILLQELWLQKLDWDDEIPQHLQECWLKIKTNLRQLNTIRIPRHIGYIKNAHIQIHGYCDASIRAYGFCIYIRTQIKNSITTKLLTAKSRVAPVKTRSVPRLELCAAHLLAKWWKNHAHTLPAYNDVVFWSDSEIVLLWLKRHPTQLVSFVANRIADIQEWTDNIPWRHVDTHNNPADLVSRGCDVHTLKTSMWLEGPPYLRTSPTGWPVTSRSFIPEDKLELKKAVKILHSHLPEPSIIDTLCNRSSSFTKLIHIMAYTYRFICGRKHQHQSLIISTDEFQFAFYKYIELIQFQFFEQEISTLKKGGNIKSVVIQQLSPFLNKMSIAGRTLAVLRVGGRLCKSSLPYNAKFPVLITAKHEFVYTYTRYLHITNCHAGSKALLSILRENVWIINARKLVRKVVRQCVHCFRYKPVLEQQIMGSLPANRLSASRAFINCGVDFCGPFYTSMRIRGRPPYKTYVAVFICFATKAVHLELVSNLSTDAFLLTLKRFIGRRGCPHTITSDNGTNFVGASAALEELRATYMAETTKNAVLQLCAEKGIEFRFIPPRAPHFGGLWEAAVKAAKMLLLRAVGNMKLTYEELNTVLIDVEAILNSRPIVVTNDPNDGDVLTPAHFLIGSSLREVPGGSSPQNGHSCYKQWRQLSCLKGQLWSSFQREYVTTLQQRNKWTVEAQNVLTNAVVLIHEDNVPPQQWLLGRITAIIPGADGKVRVVDVRTTNGILRRPVAKIAVLPIAHNGS